MIQSSHFLSFRVSNVAFLSNITIISHHGILSLCPKFSGTWVPPVSLSACRELTHDSHHISLSLVEDSPDIWVHKTQITHQILGFCSARFLLPVKFHGWSCGDSPVSSLSNPFRDHQQHRRPAVEKWPNSPCSPLTSPLTRGPRENLSVSAMLCSGTQASPSLSLSCVSAQASLSSTHRHQIRRKH